MLRENNAELILRATIERCQLISGARSVVAVVARCASRYALYTRRGAVVGGIGVCAGSRIPSGRSPAASSIQVMSASYPLRSPHATKGKISLANSALNSALSALNSALSVVAAAAGAAGSQHPPSRPSTLAHKAPPPPPPPHSLAAMSALL